MNEGPSGRGVLNENFMSAAYDTLIPSGQLFIPGMAQTLTYNFPNYDYSSDERIEKSFADDIQSPLFRFIMMMKNGNAIFTKISI